MTWAHESQCVVSITVFIKAVTEFPLVSRGGNMDSLSRWGCGKVLEEFVGPEILLSLFSNNILCHTC